MSGFFVHITPLEEQVLTVLGVQASSAISTERINRMGSITCEYPSDWAGVPQYRKNLFFYPTFPKINLTLGRLVKKGLVKREESPHLSPFGYTTGKWRLTDQGKLLLGIEIS